MLAAMVSLSANTQTIKVPDAVTKAFASKYPTASNVKWGKENATEYEAEFKMNNNSVSANFKSDGNWVETETVIPVADLPVAVSTSIKNKYSGSVISGAEKTEMPGNKLIYEVTITTNGKKKSVELKPDGSIIK